MMQMDLISCICMKISFPVCWYLTPWSSLRNVLFGFRQKSFNRRSTTNKKADARRITGSKNKQMQEFTHLCCVNISILFYTSYIFLYISIHFYIFLHFFTTLYISIFLYIENFLTLCWTLFAILGVKFGYIKHISAGDLHKIDPVNFDLPTS